MASKNEEGQPCYEFGAMKNSLWYVAQDPAGRRYWLCAGKGDQHGRSHDRLHRDRRDATHARNTEGPGWTRWVQAVEPTPQQRAFAPQPQLPQPPQPQPQHLQLPQWPWPPQGGWMCGGMGGGMGAMPGL